MTGSKATVLVVVYWNSETTTGRARKILVNSGFVKLGSLCKRFFSPGLVSFFGFMDTDQENTIWALIR